jgi:hypothetical protein
LKRHELAPRGLVLELTEGVAMENPVAVTTLLMRLRAMGIRISLDDFGTGYSSLAYLRQFPVDALKIDQSFVRGLANDKDTAVIVTGIVAMAKDLGLYVVAEGVETDVQRAALHALHCESVQGYLVARPMDARSATSFLLAGGSSRVPVATETSAPVAPSRRETETTWLAFLAPIGRDLLVTAAVAAVVLSAGVGTIFYRSQFSQSASATPHLPAQSMAAGVAATNTATNTEVKDMPAPVTAGAASTAKPDATIKPAASVVHVTRPSTSAAESPAATPATKPALPATPPVTSPTNAATPPTPQPAATTNSAGAPAANPSAAAPVVSAPVAAAETRPATPVAPAAAAAPTVASTTKTPPPAASSSASSSGSAAAALVTSFDVVHLHRIGKCRGRLAVSRTGVAFVPDNKEPDDTITLKYGEFIQMTEGKTLTIRSAARAYRFMLDPESSTNPADMKIATVSDAITHASRRGSSTPASNAPSTPPASARSTPPAAPATR